MRLAAFILSCCLFLQSAPARAAEPDVPEGWTISKVVVLASSGVRAPTHFEEQLQSNLALGLETDNHRQCKKSDGVYLMEHIDCTGVLVECGFLSNYEEEQRLLQPEYQKKLAAVIAGTLSVWLSEEHPNEI